MNAPTNQPPGFLAALAAVTRHENFSVQIEVEDTRLRIRIQVEGHDALEAVGPPADLDAQLPAAIEKYARWLDEQGAVEIDLPGGTAAAKAPAQRKKPAPRPAAKKKAAPRRAPAARRAPSPKKAAAPSAHANPPSKDECVADYKAMKAKHGGKLTRVLFIRASKTRRRYEKLFPNWDAFAKAAEGNAATPAAPSTPAKAKAPKAAAPKKASTQKNAPKAAPPKDEKRPWTIKLKGKGGKTLGATIVDKKPGDPYTHSSGKFIVDAIDADKREIYVAPADDRINPPGSVQPRAPASDKPPADEKPKDPELPFAPPEAAPQVQPDSTESA